ncbi:hypothetical protein [Thalassococcus lentus]|uniref:Uncharacterized protein n=1 Tax=Thalassococcus lentus TaxID=1210524 RepID=A0ABT4XXL0_9RHOB|nr:hypothetical protein [Thalassococcus lentus]MDA7426667.1 hypothetical protein [Thalassococcus lentus]
MQTQTNSDTPLSKLCRALVALLIAGFWPGRSAEEIDAQIATLEPGQHNLVLGGVLTFTVLLALFALQFGLLGLTAFLLAVLAIVG